MTMKRENQCIYALTNIDQTNEEKMKATMVLDK